MPNRRERMRATTPGAAEPAMGQPALAEVSPETSLKGLRRTNDELKALARQAHARARDEKLAARARRNGSGEQENAELQQYADQVTRLSDELSAKIDALAQQSASADRRQTWLAILIALVSALIGWLISTLGTPGDALKLLIR